MNVFCRMIKIKLWELVSQPFLLLLLIVFPVILGSIAGTANSLNTRNHIDLAVVDEDQSVTSRILIAELIEQGWNIYELDVHSAEQRLIRQQIDGILTIEDGFAAMIRRSDRPMLRYREAEGSMMTALAREVIAATIMPLVYRESLLNNLSRVYAQVPEDMPDDFGVAFYHDIEKLRRQDNYMQIEYGGDMVITPTLTFVVSDFSMEVFFLSIYAIIGSMALSKAALRQRLSATTRGLSLDYATTIVSLQALGMIQILFYSLAMFWLMQQPLQSYHFGVLAVFLLFMLGAGQLLALIEESLRLYLSLLLLLLSAVLGGCFFQVSFRLMVRYGQYGPHGWALMALRRAEAMPVWLVLILAVLLLVLGFFAQKRRARTDLSL